MIDVAIRVGHKGSWVIDECVFLYDYPKEIMKELERDESFGFNLPVSEKKITMTGHDITLKIKYGIEYSYSKIDGWLRKSVFLFSRTNYNLTKCKQFNIIRDVDDDNNVSSHYINTQH